jgi:hypothetical protein
MKVAQSLIFGLIVAWAAASTAKAAEASLAEANRAAAALCPVEKLPERALRNERAAYHGGIKIGFLKTAWTGDARNKVSAPLL